MRSLLRDTSTRITALRETLDRSTIDEVLSITPDVGRGWPLFRSLLAAMVVVMLAETLLAWRFGGAA